MSKLTFAEIKAAKKSPTQSVYIITDDDLSAEYAQKAIAFSEAQTMLTINPSDDDYKERFEEANLAFDEVQDRVKEASLKFVFKAVNRRKLEDLLEAHPATNKQKKDAKDNNTEINFNWETFPPALISAALVSPELTHEEVTEIWTSDEWTSGELGTLFNTAMEVNQRGGAVNLKRG